MKADNKGEGGSLALLALISRSSGEARWTWPIVLLGVFATALFYGDSMITPAMSVLSATEGLSYVHVGFKPYIVPVALAIRSEASRVGKEGVSTCRSRGTPYHEK